LGFSSLGFYRLAMAKLGRGLLGGGHGPPGLPLYPPLARTAVMGGENGEDEEEVTRVTE